MNVAVRLFGWIVLILGTPIAQAWVPENLSFSRGKFIPYVGGGQFSSELARYHLKAAVYERKTDSGTERMPFLLFKPKVKAHKIPLLLYFGGTGESGSDLARHFNQRAIFDRVTSAEFQQQHPCYLFAPMLADYKEFSGSLPEEPTECSDFVLEAMYNVIERLGKDAVDTNRLYTTGLSFGGCASFEMVCYYPRIFAAALPIAAVESEYMLPESSRVNIWCIENRPVLSQMRIELYQRMKERVIRSGGDFRFSALPKKGHNAWNDAWAEDAPWDWLFSKSCNGLSLVRHAVGRKNQRSTVDLSFADCSSDLSPISPEHCPKCGADGLDGTYFQAEHAKSGNWWMMDLSCGVVGEVTVKTGITNGRDILQYGVVEVSKDGRIWHQVATFDHKTGEATFRLIRVVRKIRVRCVGNGIQRLVIRDVKVELSR